MRQNTQGKTLKILLFLAAADPQKTSVPKMFIGPWKIFEHFLFAFKVLL